VLLPRAQPALLQMALLIHGLLPPQEPTMMMMTTITDRLHCPT
jgi:hypothetical protein